MKRNIKKLKFKKGRGSNLSILRKLTLNFLKHGHVKTTLMKAKTLKSHVDRLAFKSRMNRESDKNMLLRHLGDRKAVQYMLDTVGPSFSKRTGGFTTLVKLGPRQGDSAEMAVLQWIKPIKRANEEKLAKKETKAISTKAKTADKKKDTKVSKKS